MIHYVIMIGNREFISTTYKEEAYDYASKKKRMGLYPRIVRRIVNDK